MCAVVVSIMLVLPISMAVFGVGSAETVYEYDGEEHLVPWAEMSLADIDGVISGEWTESEIVGHLWCTSEADPVGDVYVCHDDEILYIGALAIYPDSLMADDGHWVRIDWNRDCVFDLADNMGNEPDVIFELGANAFEYAIPLDNDMIIDDRLNILLLAEMTGLPSDPDGETTTFPYRPPGKFKFTTLVLDEPAPAPPPNIPPVAIAGLDKTVDIGELVFFDASGSFDVDGAVVEYAWDFGDGASGSGMYPSHTYMAEGIYDVTLTVTDDDDATSSDSCQAIVLGAPCLEYSVDYVDQADMTTVDSGGIHFFTSGANPDRLITVPFNSTYVLPQEDYGDYALYNRTTPVHFVIHITNMNQYAHGNVVVWATQEFHNTVTIWDHLGELDLFKGMPLGGDSTEYWNIGTLAPGQTITLEGYHYFIGRGWGLDQTHLSISVGGNVIVDDSEAGVYCPP